MIVVVAAPALDAALAELAASGRTLTYGALAAQLGLDGPGRIARLTQALEDSMERDARAGQRLRAAHVVARLGGGLPAPGFFAKARALGLYDGPDCDAPAQAFHAAQLGR